MATRKRIKLAALTIGAGWLFVVGCSTALPSQTLSSVPTAGQYATQMQKDAIECDALAVSSGQNESVAAGWAWGGVIGANIAQTKNQRQELAIYRACMQTRGYTTQGPQ